MEALRFLQTGSPWGQVHTALLAVPGVFQAHPEFCALVLSVPFTWGASQHVQLSSSSRVFSDLPSPPKLKGFMVLGHHLTGLLLLTPFVACVPLWAGTFHLRDSA